MTGYVSAMNHFYNYYIDRMLVFNLKILIFCENGASVFISGEMKWDCE